MYKMSVMRNINFFMERLLLYINNHHFSSFASSPFYAGHVTGVYRRTPISDKWSWPIEVKIELLNAHVRLVRNRIYAVQHHWYIYELIWALILIETNYSVISYVSLSVGHLGLKY